LAGGHSYSADDGEIVFLPDITPDSTGKPAGLTYRQFVLAMRYGQDPAANSILQVMPYPNLRLSAVRKMVSEARKNGMLGAEEAANLTGVPNIPQKGTRLGNWLTREQARELLADLEGKGRRVLTVAIPVW
jgi:hypothetical protein